MSSTTPNGPGSMTNTANPSSTSNSATLQAGDGNLKVVGILLAVASGLLIGSSFVFKKKGLISSQKVQGEGVGYLKSPLWWTGMIMMILGELCNFAAYAFVEALVVTPLGALSVVVCAILSSFFLKEKLSFFGWLGCGLCIIGSVIIAINTPGEQALGQIQEFQKLFISPGFLAYIGVLIAISLSIMVYFGPKYGTKSMFWYITVCSLIGGISVSVTTGLGAAIVTTAKGDNQFKYWFIYFLLVFVVVTLLTEVFYLNKALALYNTAMVTPTYYVIFTFCTIVTTIVLFQGLKATALQIITIIMGFLTICVGITILQMSKIDPEELSKNNNLDRRSTLLLQAARSQVHHHGGPSDEEKQISGYEDPGMDTLRGGFGAVGSIIRANTARRMSMNSRASMRSRATSARAGSVNATSQAFETSDMALPGLQRHQLYDAPVRLSTPERERADSMASDGTATGQRNPTIKFDKRDVVHQYHPTGQGDTVRHDIRAAQAYPPSSVESAPSNSGGVYQVYTPDRNPSGPPALHSKFFTPPETATPDESPEIPSAPYRSGHDDSSRRAKFNKPYPRTQDDKEEVERLFTHRTGQQSIESMEPSTPVEELDDQLPPSGIRLVKPNSGPSF